MADEEAEEKWVNHYSSNHQILLVGEGDFSFSLSLALSFGSASKICASSLDRYDVVVTKYKKAGSNLEILKNLGALLLHGVDATKMKQHPDLNIRRFDRVVFNFPHAGFNGKENNAHLIEMHRKLIHGFFKCASHMLKAKGEIHVSHKDRAPFSNWNLEELASQSSLVLIERVDFKKADYLGYENKRGDGTRCDEPFPLGECSTFKFRFSPRAKIGKSGNFVNQRTKRSQGALTQVNEEPVSFDHGYHQKNHMQFQDDSVQGKQRPASFTFGYPERNSIWLRDNPIQGSEQIASSSFSCPVRNDHHHQEPFFDPHYIQKNPHIITKANERMVQFGFPPKVGNLNEFSRSFNGSSCVAIDTYRNRPTSYSLLLQSQRHDLERYNEELPRTFTGTSYNHPETQSGFKPYIGETPERTLTSGQHRQLNMGTIRAPPHWPDLEIYNEELRGSTLTRRGLPFPGKRSDLERHIITKTNERMAQFGFPPKVGNLNKFSRSFNGSSCVAIDTYRNRPTSFSLLPPSQWHDLERYNRELPRTFTGTSYNHPETESGFEPYIGETPERTLTSGQHRQLNLGTIRDPPHWPDLEIYSEELLGSTLTRGLMFPGTTSDLEPYIAETRKRTLAPDPQFYFQKRAKLDICNFHALSHW